MADERRLRLFISYSSEDRVLATAIGDELRRCFNPTALKVDIDVEFSLGENWRNRLMDDLNKTDILLVVATGREKISHSFTGFEVGFFSNSIAHVPMMPHFPKQARVVIPLAMFTKTPETLADIQALQIDDPVVVDPLSLRDPVKQMNVAAIKNHPILRLFRRIRSILNQDVPLNDEELEASSRQLQDSAARLIEIVYEQLRHRVFHENFPERKIVVRTPLPARNARSDEVLSNATVEFFGHFDTFGFEAPRSGVVPWPDFAATISQDDIARVWTDTVQLLVSSALRGDFRDNRQVVTTREKDRAFRMFVTRSVIYYSAVHEFHIDIVEIKYKDFGDRTTTMLLKAISMGLQYRFMFLEGKTSEFSPESFNATLLDSLRERISEMIQQLNYLLWFSNDAGLKRPENILLILGEMQSGELEAKAAQWEEAKTQLYESSQKTLASTDDRELLRNKAEFVAVLQGFCDSTQVMNEDFTSKVLRALDLIVSGKAADDHVERAA